MGGVEDGRVSAIFNLIPPERQAAAAAYQSFLEAKIASVPSSGFEIAVGDVNPACKPHVRAIVPWMVGKGRAGCFSLFGMQKTSTQLEAVRLTRELAGGNALIVCPLGVRQEFRRDAMELLGWPRPPRFIRSTEEITDEDEIYITNWESVRERKIDPRRFTVATFDEADALRSFGSKTFGEVVIGPWHEIKYRYVASATPDPNDYIELLGYAQFLGVMDIGQSKTRFFKRDSEHADNLTLYPHKEAEFWLWVASWGLVIQRPSDLGFSDDGYLLPPLDIRWHEIPSDHRDAGEEKNGQRRLQKDVAVGVRHAAKEKRESLPARVAKMLELRDEDPDAHRMIWHDLEDERRAIEAAIPDVVSVYGTQALEDREKAVAAFADGQTRELASKPVLLGAGVNLQRHCSWQIFLGIGYKFRDILQALHRLYRFGQTKPVRVDFIYTEAERSVRAGLEAKWARYNKQTAKLAAIIRELGLAEISMASLLTRSMGIERAEVSGEKFCVVNNDCVLETMAMDDDSTDLIFTSPPFSTQYEYTPSFNDFGHTDSTEHFWAQMDFLTPELYRVLRPGRDLVIHIKDRVVPGGMTGLGFQVVDATHADAIAHYKRHGFAFLGMKTIVTDVVRENAQTYRLGYTENCKDGTRMGAGLPEYLLIFRKPPSDRSNGYADVPVVKSKEEYSRSRWQFDAHGFMRSSGNRLLTPEEIVRLPWKSIFRIFRDHSLNEVYDFEQDVALAEALEKCEPSRLPPDFMLLQPASHHPDVWTDVARMRSLNGSQAARSRDKHLCPLPFDIVHRTIVQRSQPGEVVYDPFLGLGTTVYCAIKLGRRARGSELSPQYFKDVVYYARLAVAERATPSLFDVLDVEAEEVQRDALAV
jgi:DNA modification methylase